MSDRTEEVQPVRGRALLRAILTDVQFWIPALVLLFGLVLLVVLHRG